MVITNTVCVINKSSTGYFIFYPCNFSVPIPCNFDTEFLGLGHITFWRIKELLVEFEVSFFWRPLFCVMITFVTKLFGPELRAAKPLYNHSIWWSRLSVLKIYLNK